MLLTNVIGKREELTPVAASDLLSHVVESLDLRVSESDLPDLIANPVADEVDDTKAE